MIIYRIFNKEDQTSYIGQTKQPLKQRLRDHIRKAIYRGKNNKLSQAIRECGVEMFDIEELFFIGPFDYPDSKELQRVIDEKEIYFINKYNSVEEGYNTRKGGQGFTERKSLSPEERAKKEAEHYTKKRERQKKYYEENKEEILARRKKPNIYSKKRARQIQRALDNPEQAEIKSQKHKEYMKKRNVEKRLIKQQGKDNVTIT